MSIFRIDGVEYDPKDFFKNFRFYDGELKNGWITFYPKNKVYGISYNYSFYFDERPVIHLSLSGLILFFSYLVSLFFLPLWCILLTPLVFFAVFSYGIGEMFIHLPIHSGVEDSCDWEKLGFHWMDNTLVLESKGKFKTVYFPWNFKWYSTSKLMKDGQWLTDHCKSSGKPEVDFFKEKTYNNLFTVERPFSHTNSYGDTVNTIIYCRVDRREWRRNWLMSIPLFNKVQYSFDFEVKDPIGDNVDSWKGGVCGFGERFKYKKTENELEFLKETLETILIKISKKRFR